MRSGTPRCRRRPAAGATPSRLTDDEAALIGAGTPRDWIEETRALCREVYEASPAGSDLSYDYVARFAPVVELQFLKGGYRLARLLNDIYQ